MNGLCGLPMIHLRSGQSRSAGAAFGARCGTLAGGASQEAAGRTRGALPEAVSCSGALAGGSLPAPHPMCSLTQPLPRSLDRGLDRIMMVKACSQDPNEAVAVISL